MPDISRKDVACLLNMLDAIQRIQLYSGKFSDADSFYHDGLSFDATLMNFVVIGEMVEKLSDTFRATTSGVIEWPKIKGFRNIIAHNYFGIDAEEVWQIIHGNLPELRSAIEVWVT